ncbi:MAG TPA: DUF4097 family beta strand repeat-containing protein [Candidatus Dormibacteraeota bacterium]|nr:DUF4097 family beta strand repeat-containing protein [Candidatus Dormibacteraeota bacterium]
MAYSPRNSSGLFSGLVLLIFGCILLAHNYRGLELGSLFFHWWPLLIIALGLIKLYERAAGTRFSEPGAARITGGEIFLVIAVLAIAGIVVAVEQGQKRYPWISNSFPFDIDVPSKSVPADARITIHGNRGDIDVRPGNTDEIRVSGKANVHTWNESEASRMAKPVSAEVVKNGDGFEVRPTGIGGNSSRIGVDMDVTVPPRSSVTVRNDKGDVTVSDMEEIVAIYNGSGDVEVRDNNGDVTIDTHKGDIKVSDTKGNIKIEGQGGEVNVENATGGLTLNGEFFGPIRAEKVAKGVRFISQRTDLTLTQLSGHMELSSGNLEIADAPGNLNLRTNRYDIDVENAGGKVDIMNRDASVSVRFPAAPKEDVQINNSNSSISLSLPGSANFQIEADCKSCDINSDFEGDSLKANKNESGDTHLEGKVGNGRGPKITLRTSYGSISLRKTSVMETPERPERPEVPQHERRDHREQPEAPPAAPKHSVPKAPPKPPSQSST